MVFAGAPAIVAAAIPPTPPPQAAKPRRTTGSTELQASDEHHHTEQVLDSSDTAQGTWDGSQDDYTTTQRAIELVSKMRAHMQLLQQQRDEAVRQLKFRDVTIRKLQVQLHQAESRIQDVQVREKMGTSISSRLVSVPQARSERQQALTFAVTWCAAIVIGRERSSTLARMLSSDTGPGVMLPK